MTTPVAAGTILSGLAAAAILAIATTAFVPPSAAPAAADKQPAPIVDHVLLGTDPYMDGSGIHLGHETDSFRVDEIVNAIVVFRPTAEEASLSVAWRFDVPIATQGQPRPNARFDSRGGTLLRMCIRASTVDREGLGIPRGASLIVDGQEVATFTFAVLPGNEGAPIIEGPAPCEVPPTRLVS